MRRTASGSATPRCSRPRAAFIWRAFSALVERAIRHKYITFYDGDQAIHTFLATRQLLLRTENYLLCKGRGYPALWRSLLRPAPLAASAPLLTPFHNWRLQPHPDQPHDRPVHDPHAYTRQKLGVWNRIEIAFQVRVTHDLIPGLQMTAYLLERLMGRASRSEPIRTIQEICLKNRLQD